MNSKFVQALNNMRVDGSSVLHDMLPEIKTSADIAKWSEVIFQNPQVYSEFCDGLVSKLIKSQFETKIYRNKFNVFNGEDIPFGYSMENAYTNPAIGTDYDPNDFAGILARYEADTKVEYFKVNSDKQYKVTVYRDELRKAMLSLDALGRYITNLTNSLYNGAYIDMKRRTVGIVGSAYANNRIHIKKLSAVTDKATAEAFAVKARTLFLNFQEESDEYNSWSINGGAGRPVVTWTEPEDMYIIIKNSVLSELDVKSLANAFNIEEASLMGKIIGVNNFKTYDSEGNVVDANDDLFAVMCDRRKEAARIMYQYGKLNLCGLHREEGTLDDIDDGIFMSIPVEIIFIFSHGFNMDSIIDNKKVSKIIAPVLSKYDIDNVEEGGVYLERVEDCTDMIASGVESQKISAYRFQFAKKAIP